MKSIRVRENNAFNVVWRSTHADLIFENKRYSVLCGVSELNRGFDSHMDRKTNVLNIFTSPSHLLYATVSEQLLILMGRNPNGINNHNILQLQETQFPLAITYFSVIETTQLYLIFFCINPCDKDDYSDVFTVTSKSFKLYMVIQHCQNLHNGVITNATNRNYRIQAMSLFTEVQSFFVPLFSKEIRIIMTGLRKNSIGLLETTFQGIAGSAPAGAAVATFTGAAFFALGAFPLTAFLAFLVVLLNAFIIRKLSRHIAGSGGYYSYVREGLGISSALFAGLFYIFYQIMALSFMGISLAVFVLAIFSSVFGVSILTYSWFPILSVSILFGYLISRSGIKQSVRYTTIMAMTEIVVIGISEIFILVSHPSLNTTEVFNPALARNGFLGVGIGVLFMYTAFSGFGASTPLGEESRTAQKTIGLSVVLSIIILGVFFIFTAYVFTVAYGVHSMGSYANALVPGVQLVKTDLGSRIAILITALFINSLLTGTVVITNGTSRVMYTMSREGFIPEGFSRIHQIRMTPSTSAGVVAVAAFLISTAGIIFLNGFNAFLMTATAATLRGDTRSFFC